MKKISLILIGGGFSSIEIIDLIEDVNKIEKKKYIEIVGILDDHKKIGSTINGVKIIGKLSDAKNYKTEKFFINIFDRNNRFIRQNLIKKLKVNLSRFISIIHPHNLIGKNAKIGTGVSIYPGCTIFSNSRIGNFCNIMPNASVASNTVIENNCFIGKDVFMGSGSRAKENVYISNGTTVLENVFINEGNRIIPHSIINKDISEKKMIVGGTPAKILFKEIIAKTINKKSQFRIRLANNQDSDFLLRLYNRNVIEKNFFSQKIVTLQKHNSWFKNKINEKMIFVCLYGIYKVGYLRFDRISKKNLSVSIAIKKKYQRRGFGRILLNKALNKKDIRKYNLLAFVVKKNVKSKKFFLNLGFKFLKNNKFIMKAK